MLKSRWTLAALCSLLLAGAACSSSPEGGSPPPAGTGGSEATGSGGRSGSGGTPSSAGSGGATSGSGGGGGGMTSGTGGASSGSGGSAGAAGTGGAGTGGAAPEDAGATDSAAPGDTSSSGGPRITDGLTQLLVSRAIGLGYYHACHLLASKDIKCYGDPQTEPRMVPPKIKSDQVFCAHNGCCVLTGQGAAPPSPPALPDGTVALTINAKRLTCWGHKNTFFPPAAMDMDPLTFGIGYDHGCVLNTDHTVKCWGQPGTMNAPPAGLTAKSLSISAFFNCAVKMDDSVVCWGINPPQPPEGLKAKIVATIFHGSPKLPDAPTGTRHACAIQLDDTVKCWGDNIAGTTDVPANLGPVKDIAVATFNSCALKLDGEPICWGTKKYNEVVERFHPMPAGLKLKGIRSKLATYCGLQMDDTMACWGDESSSHITIPAGTKFYAQ
jgi:hypothetical protein